MQFFVSMKPVECYVTRYYQMMSTLLKLGLSGYDVKPRFGAFQCEYLLQNPLFFEEKILVTLDTHTKKMNLPSIIFLGGGCTVRPAGS